MSFCWFCHAAALNNFQDRHTTGNHTAPILDASQDWFLLHGEENEQGTILKFVRKLDTCDTPDDIPIGVSTVDCFFVLFFFYL